MELESKEAIEALKNYKAKDLAEELVVELLLTPSSDRDGLAAMADKIVDSDLSDVEVENLHLVVGRIRREVGIDQEIEDQEIAKLDFSRMNEYDSIALEVIDEEIKILEQRIADRENRLAAIWDKSNELFAQAKKISDDYFAANEANALYNFQRTKEGEGFRELYQQIGLLEEEEDDLRDEDPYDQNQLIILHTIHHKIMNKIKEKNE